MVLQIKCLKIEIHLAERITISILAIVVLPQVVLGFQLLSGTKAMLMSHEANGFLVVLLSLVMGGITSMGARKQGAQRPEVKRIRSVHVTFKLAA